MREDSITAIIPTFNRRTYVARALESVFSQSKLPDEVIVVDDGSTDGTMDFVTSIYGSRVTLISQPNAGVSSARRTGLQAAQGSWIAFLDSDDEWTVGRMARLSEVAKAMPADVAWVFGDTQLVTDDDDQQTLYGLEGLHPSGPFEIYDDPLPTQFPFQFSLLQSSLVRRSALLNAGGFVEDLRTSEDFLISFRVALRARFAAIAGVVTRLYRTKDLAATSLDSGARRTQAFWRARSIAFAEAAATRGQPWARHFAEAVRRMHTAVEDPPARPSISLAMKAARYSPDVKTLTFALASFFGPNTVQAVAGLGGRGRRGHFPA
jgi:glycosyltransferase involved in cell wall biosynthesis